MFMLELPRYSGGNARDPYLLTSYCYRNVDRYSLLE
jgi:hypothetical protein